MFIAANIIDESLIRGAWGDRLLDLVREIGVQRVFVSVYGGPKDALESLDGRLGELGVREGRRRVVSEEVEPVRLGSVQKTRLPSGRERVERIAFLAEVRNRALRPLSEGKERWGKVLFVNDVFFDVGGALRLLWGSDGEEGEKRGKPKAVCAADFVAPWKYYDTFATRDTEGYSLGVPIFPWFANVGHAISRRDVLAGKDRVRVKSCWGGMVAFDGSYFQAPASDTIPSETGVSKPHLPLKFRSEKEPFWDASECCLIHADIMAASEPPTPEDEWDTGIYMNPFVRVSYDADTQKYIWVAKRFEALFSIPQAIINTFASMPRFNPRRAEIEGQIIPDRLWISSVSGTSEEEQVRLAREEWGNGVVSRDEVVLGERGLVGELRDKEYWRKEGYYIPFNRTARRGGYCGVRQLLVMKEGEIKEGEGNWDTLLGEVPPLDMR